VREREVIIHLTVLSSPSSRRLAWYGLSIHTEGRERERERVREWREGENERERERE
jgi:hypothetical protein